MDSFESDLENLEPAPKPYVGLHTPDCDALALTEVSPCDVELERSAVAELAPP